MLKTTIVSLRLCLLSWNDPTIVPTVMLDTPIEMDMFVRMDVSAVGSQHLVSSQNGLAAKHVTEDLSLAHVINIICHLVSVVF